MNRTPYPMTSLRHRLPNADKAISSVLASMLILGGTVAIVGVAATQLESAPVSEAPPRLTMGALGALGDTTLMLLHEGGDPIDLGDVKVSVSVDGTPVSMSQAGRPGEMWLPGDSLEIPIPQGAAPGARVEVSLVDQRRAATLAVASVSMPTVLGALAAPTGFQVEAGLASLTGAPLSILPGSTVRIDVPVEHPEGRKYLRYVYADLSGIGGPTWIDLHDDGTNGDLLASDGVFGGTLTVPSLAPVGAGSLTIYAVDLDGVRTSTTIAFVIDSTTPPPPPAAPRAPFEILPGGGVRPSCDGPLELRVVGVDITYGLNGPRIPVRAQATFDNGATMRPLYGGRAVAEGMTERFNVTTSDQIGVRGQANYLTFNSAYRSWVADPHVRVLKDGDLPPDVPAFGTIQQDIAVYLAPYVVNGRISLDHDEIIVLFEFVSDLSSSAADFQDLVVLYDFQGRTCPDTSSFTTSNVPCSELGDPRWAELKIDRPGNGIFLMGNLSVSVSGYNGYTFNWTANQGIDAVFVKSGSMGSNLYRYDPEGTAGWNLGTPGKNSISHISFCFDA